MWVYDPRFGWIYVGATPIGFQGGTSAGGQVIPPPSSPTPVTRPDPSKSPFLPGPTPSTNPDEGLPPLSPGVLWWLQTHPSSIPGVDPNTGSDPNRPIDKGGNPPPPPPYDPIKATIDTAVAAAQKILRDRLDSIRAALSWCDGNDKDGNPTGDSGNMDSLLDCLAAEGGSDGSTPDNYSPITNKDLQNDPNLPKGAEGFTDDTKFPYQIYLDLNQIAKDQKNPKLNPPDSKGKTLSYQEMVNRVLLHEMIHNCSKDQGLGSNPDVLEVDAEVICNMLGYPVDIKGINQANYSLSVLPDDQTVRDERTSQGLNSGSGDWLNGNYFQWNSKTGEVRCQGGDNHTILGLNLKLH